MVVAIIVSQMVERKLIRLGNIVKEIPKFQSREAI